MENNEFAAIVTDDSALQPIGGLTMDDVREEPEFADESFEKYFEEYAESAGEPNDSAEAEEAPTTEPNQPAAEQEATEDSPTTENSDGHASGKIKVRVKVDHKEQDIDIDHEDLPGIWQRANNYDRLHKKFSEQEEKVQGLTVLANQLGFESIEAMVNHAAEKDREDKVQALVDEGTARNIAEDYIDRQTEKARLAKKSQDAATQAQDQAKTNAPDYKAQVEDLFKVRPDLNGKLKKLPEEVTKAVVEENIPLRTAYAEWEARQARAEQDRLRKENERFAQTAEAASRAPVRGTKDADTNGGSKPDPFEKGFREYKW